MTGVGYPLSLVGNRGECKRASLLQTPSTQLALSHLRRTAWTRPPCSMPAGEVSRSCSEYGDSQIITQRPCS